MQWPLVPFSLLTYILFFSFWLVHNKLIKRTKREELADLSFSLNWYMFDLFLLIISFLLLESCAESENHSILSLRITLQREPSQFIDTLDTLAHSIVIYEPTFLLTYWKGRPTCSNRLSTKIPCLHFQTRLYMISCDAFDALLSIFIVFFFCIR